MALNFVQRARVSMARIKDDSEPAGSQVDAAIALKYANAFVLVYRKDLLIDAEGNPIAIGDVDNEVKAKAYINYLRKKHKEVLEASRVPGVVKAARIAEESSIDSEFPTDLGTEE